MNQLELESCTDRELLKIILKKVGDIESKVDDLHDIIHGNEAKGMIGIREQVNKNTSKIQYWEKWQFAAGVVMGAFGIIYSAYLAVISLKEHILIK